MRLHMSGEKTSCSIFEKVAEFHRAVGHPVRTSPSCDTDVVPYHEQALRYNLIREELEEYLRAIADGDLVAIADSLTDLLYVVAGSFLVFGLDPMALFNEVHRSNMSKVSSGYRVRDDGKIVKGPDYSPPDILSVIRRMGAAKPERVAGGDAQPCPRCGRICYVVEGRKDAFCSECGYKFPCCEGI